MRPINAATPAQVAAFRAGQHAAMPAKASKLLVSACAHSWSDGFELQLPIVTQASNAKGHWSNTWADVTEQAAITVFELCRLTAARDEQRTRIEHITFKRISPGRLDEHDNLRQAFKHVVDGCLFWREVGPRAALHVEEYFDRRSKRMRLRLRAVENIGRYDDVEKTGGITWDYQQETNSEDRRRHGVRIRFRLRPKSETTTTP